MLLEANLEADSTCFQLLLLTLLVPFLLQCWAGSCDLPSRVPLPLSAVLSIPFTSSVRLIAARSRDFAGSSERKGMHEGTRKQLCIHCLCVLEICQNGKTKRSRLCIGVHQKKHWRENNIPGPRRWVWKVARYSNSRKVGQNSGLPAVPLGLPLSSCRTQPALACWCPLLLGNGCLLPTEQQISPCWPQKPEKVPRKCSPFPKPTWKYRFLFFSYIDDYTACYNGIILL